MNQAVKSKYKLTNLAYAAPKKWVKKVVKDLRGEGYNVDANWSQGFITADIDGQVIFRALRFSGGNWNCRGASEVFTPDQPNIGDVI